MWNNIKEFKSSDTNVKKYVFTKEDCVVEAVLYKYNDYLERTVICCSTQSGCPVGCKFCGTGKFFIRSLTTEEIVSQVRHLLEHNSIQADSIKNFQIMVMSMGEPMLNYNNFIEAFKELNQLYPNAKLLVSTTAPRIDYKAFLELSESIDKIGLQFSIHESTDERRNSLIPFKNKLTLEECGKLGEEFLLRTGRKPFFNYCASTENSSETDVENLIKNFNPSVFEATVSVICEKDESIQSSIDRQRELAEEFSSKLLQKGYGVRVFNPAGQDDIGGGCGQLWFVQKWIEENKSKAKKSIGFYTNN